MFLSSFCFVYVCASLHVCVRLFVVSGASPLLVVQLNAQIVPVLKDLMELVPPKGVTSQ
jgi:hypothetical protein